MSDWDREWEYTPDEIQDIGASIVNIFKAGEKKAKNKSKKMKKKIKKKLKGKKNG